MVMSHTSAPVPLSLGAMSLYFSVVESKTAKLATLPKTVPLRCSTLEKLPPTQMLLPTCSIALTRPSTAGAGSGVSAGTARAAPLPRSRATAVEAAKRKTRLILLPLFRRSSLAGRSGAGGKRAPLTLVGGKIRGPSGAAKREAAAVLFPLFRRSALAGRSGAGGKRAPLTLFGRKISVPSVAPMRGGRSPPRPQRDRARA